MVAQDFKILMEKEKQTVRGSALVTFFNTKQGFTVPRGKQRCMETGLCNIYKVFYVFFVFVFTTHLIVSTWHNFFYSIHFEQLRLRSRWLINKIILIQVKMFLTTTIKGGNLGPVWDKPVPDRWLCSCLNFLSFCWSSLVAFGEITFHNLVTNQLFGLDFRAVRQDTFYLHQDYEQVIFDKRLGLCFSGWSLRNGKIAVYLQLAKNWNILTKVWQNLPFLSTFPTSLRWYAKGKWKSRVCVKFEFIDSL